MASDAPSRSNAPSGPGGGGLLGSWLTGFRPYLKTKGRRTRSITFYLVEFLVFWASIRSFYFFSVRFESLGEPLWTTGAPPEPANIAGVMVTGALVCAIGVFVLLTALCYRYLNAPPRADLLIETEAEMRRVSWPSWETVWNSAWVVILAMLLLVLYMFFWDTIIELVLGTLWSLA